MKSIVIFLCTLAVVATESEPLLEVDLPTGDQWTDWTECTAACDGGITERSRMGHGMDGPEMEGKGCNDFPCASMMNYLTFIATSIMAACSSVRYFAIVLTYLDPIRAYGQIRSSLFTVL